MRYDGLLEAVSEAEPCGPDLDEVGDEVYLNYILPAAARLPERFFQKDSGAPFDRGSIDLKAEVKAISDLLVRSRDLRLLALEARFQCLAGQIPGFADCLEAVAGLLGKHWNGVHPQAADGDYTMRQNTLGAIDDRTTIILPLQYAPVARDKKVGPISLRDYLAATGKVDGAAEELKADASGLIEIMQQDANRVEVAANHAALLRSGKALSSIRDTFIEGAGYEYVPDFSGLIEVLEQLQKMIETALPDLALAAEAAAADEARPEEAAPDDGAETVFARAPDGSGVEPVRIASHAEASAALLAVERYFVGTEPSSPALILIHQARMLVGKPLVAALEILLPESAERALISFESGVRFQLGMPRMKSISDAAAANAGANGVDDASASFSAGTRPEAQALLLGVDIFFRTTEPSSPIPMLLAKAKSYMNRDFAAILADLIRAEAPKPAG